jgi:hypothetical protein
MGERVNVYSVGVCLEFTPALLESCHWPVSKCGSCDNANRWSAIGSPKIRAANRSQSAAATLITPLNVECVRLFRVGHHYQSVWGADHANDFCNIFYHRVSRLQVELRTLFFPPNFVFRGYGDDQTSCVMFGILISTLWQKTFPTVAQNLLISWVQSERR